MPIFKAKLSDGRTVTLEGDHKPTEEEVLSAVQGFKPDKAPAPQSLEPPEDETLRSVREAFAPIESERQRQRTFPAYLQEHLLEPVNRALEFSPADIANAPRNYPEAVASEILKQVNLPNVGLITGAGAIAKVPGVAADVAKAAIGSLFAKQMTEAGAQAAGKRFSGVPLTPQEKGELYVQTALGALPAAGVVAAPKLLKGKDYASRIKSTEPVSELEVRSRMGEETPLRQQPQEPAQAREPVRQEPQQGTEVPQEKVVATPLTPAEQAIEQARLAESEQGAGTKPISIPSQVQARENEFLKIFPDPLNVGEMPMTTSKEIRGHQKKVLKAMYKDYNATRHDAFVQRYNYQLGEARRIVYERNRGIEPHPQNKAVAPIAQPPQPISVPAEAVLEKAGETPISPAPTISVTPKTGKTQVAVESEPFQPDDKLIMHSPHTGEDVLVSYRGPLGKDKSVVWTGKSQMSIPTEWLRRQGEEYVEPISGSVTSVEKTQEQPVESKSNIKSYKGHIIEPTPNAVQVGYSTEKKLFGKGRKIGGFNVIQPDGYVRHFDTLKSAKSWIDDNVSELSLPQPASAVGRGAEKSAPASSLETLGTKDNIKVTVPKEATAIRVTPKDKTKGQRVYFVSDLNSGKVTAAGGEYSKVEAGTIGKDKKFKPVKGEVTVEDKTPKMVGMGGAVPSEFVTDPNSPTSIKNKQVDVERQARGLPPAIQTVRRSFGRTWDDAMAKIDRDPGYPDRLIDELKSHPRAVNEIEDAVLLHRQIDLQNEYGKTTRDLAQAYEDSKEFPNRLDDVEELKVRTAVLSDKLLELYDINKFVGTETARGLSARRMMAYEDFTLAKMELDKRTANGGRPLTEKERLDVQKLHDQIAALQKRYDDYVAKTEAKMAELSLKQAVSDIEKQPRASKGADIAALKQVAVNQITKKIKDGKKSEITNAVQRLARLFVQEGVRDRNILIDRVHEVLKQIDPEITRRETMDAISGYGDYRQLSKDEVSVELRKLKGQMQQVAKLEDMQAGRPPLKTGTERRAVSPEESRLIRLVNDAKRKFQIPIEDPNTQLRSSLDELKKRMQTRIDDLNERLAKRDFTTKKREPIKLDAVASQLKADLARAKQKFMRGLIEDRMKRRPWWVKAQDTFLRWYRGGILSSPVVFAKLTAAAIIRAGLTPLEEVTGAGISKALPKLAARAPREGYFNSRAEAKAILSQLTRGPKTAWQVLKTGEQDIDVLYGKGREGAIGEMQVRPFSVADIPGRTHAALKASTKQAEFERSLEKRLDFAIRNGIDASSPAVQLEAAVEAYKDSQRSIFLQDNRVVSAYNRALRALEEPSKVTGKPPIGSKTVATAARTLVPIVRVPSNIVAEAFQFATGSVTGSARFGMAVRRGIENLPPEQADLIMRELKKGSIGAAAILVGFLLPELWGGYYERGEKRKPTEIKPSQARIPGIAFPTVLGGPDVPQSLLHHPIFETIQAGATIRRISDKNTKDGNNGIPVGVKAAALGLIEETPFVKEMIDTAKAFNPSEQNAYFGELAKSIAEPQIVQWLAKQGDTDAAGQVIARKPKTVTQHLEMGIPGLRQNVPPKVVPATGVTW